MKQNSCLLPILDPEQVYK